MHCKLDSAFKLESDKPTADESLAVAGLDDAVLPEDRNTHNFRGTQPMAFP